jgi:hypothetical protein
VPGLVDIHTHPYGYSGALFPDDTGLPADRPRGGARRHAGRHPDDPSVSDGDVAHAIDLVGGIDHVAAGEQQIVHWFPAQRRECASSTVLITLAETAEIRCWS